MRWRIFSSPIYAIQYCWCLSVRSVSMLISSMQAIAFL